jgi:LDH2 family malate/lactate/ureidoglycolate dehydrogenase
MTVRIPAERLRAFTAAALTAAGLDPASAARTAELMNQADLQGSDGHGIIRLAPYIRRIREGGYNLKPDIRIVNEKAAMALLDGDNAMGHLVMDRAAKLAIEKAKSAGIGWVGARYSNHAGPASLYAKMALEHDMIGVYFAVGNANHLPPWGGLDMLLSTNPLAVAVPSSGVPIVLDMATTVAAYGKVKAKAQKGEMMPEGWMIDRQGNALLDPKRANEGFLLPIGGYKGYGLAVIVGLLAGTLNGAAMGKDTIDFNADYRTTTNTGQAILMIDVAAFDDVSAFKARVDRLAADLKGAEKMPNVDRIWLPGEQSHAKQIEFTKNGVPVADGVIATLKELAATLGITPLDASGAD